MRDPGVLAFYALQNVAEPGMMPKEKLVPVVQSNAFAGLAIVSKAIVGEGSTGTAFYYERTVGVTRAYSAMAANQRIDKLVRCYNADVPYNAEYVILEDGQQYRISLKQLVGDNVDLTLERLEEFYDVLTD